MKGRLNVFQAMMLRWRDLHPYSAVHAVRVDVSLDATRLARDIDRLLEIRGLTGLELDAAGRRFEYRGGPNGSTLQVVDGRREPRVTLEREMERQLNLPFARRGRIEPFRFFAVDAGQGFYLGLAYDHFVAAGDSIVVLLAQLVRRYRAVVADPNADEPWPLYPATFRRLLRRHALTLLHGLRRLPALAGSCRRGVRPRYPGGSEGYNAVRLLRLDPPQFAATLREAKRCGVTLNDLVIALLLKAVARRIDPRDPRERRHEIGVASIVNLRGAMGPDARKAFGQFLAAFRVAHPVPTDITLEALARDVNMQTARVKREELHLQSLLALGASALIWPFLSDAQRRGYHAKNYPVWGGTTLLDAGGIWANSGEPTPPSEYVRAVSTGPLAPLVLAPTSAGGALEIGITYRPTAFSAEDIAALAADFQSPIGAFAQ